MTARPARRALRPALAVAALLLGLLPSPAHAATVTVSIGDSLSPKTLTIAPGTTVRWVNESDNRYRMRSRTGPAEFDSGNLEPGESFSFTFTLAGTYPYVDDRDREDPDFHGTITVIAAPPAATATPAPDGSPPAGGGGGPVPTSAAIHMAGRTFSPGTVTIAAGGSVTFVNDDDREHTATGDSFDTGVMNGGARSTKSFPAAGSFSFLCEIHPEMRGTINVRGGGPGPVAPPPPAVTPAPLVAPSTEPGPTDQVAAIVDFAYEPPDLEVPIGTTVRWQNRGAAPHTVSADDGSFDSGLIAAGGTYERTLNAPGRFAFTCRFHPQMVGVLLVVPDPSGAAGAIPSSSSPSPSGTAGAASTSPAGVADAGPPDGPAQPDTAPVTAQVTDGLLRLLAVAAIVAGAVLAFGAVVVTSARVGSRSH